MYTNISFYTNNQFNQCGTRYQTSVFLKITLWIYLINAIKCYFFPIWNKQTIHIIMLLIYQFFMSPEKPQKKLNIYMGFSTRMTVEFRFFT